MLVHRARDADMVGQGEAALEGAGGDAAVQVGALGLVNRLAGRDEERAVLDLDAQLVRGEPGDGDRDAVRILGGLFDVVGG